MPRKVSLLLILALLLVAFVPATAAQDDEFVFGVVLVGGRNDGGWSQAHYEGGLYVEEMMPGTRMIYFENLNPNTPEATMESVVTDMVGEGAQLIITASDEFEEDTAAVAEQFPDVVFINVSGDDVLTGEAPPNLGNVMGEMEWGKMMAGCAAALTTETGSIGYLGPLINAETRRLASSAYLGARYCYEQYAGGSPEDLTFTVTWIGFWFNIPTVTLDPLEEVNRFFDNGVDVVISGIDTTEALAVAKQRAAQGESVWAVPYDFMNACDEAPEICLGVPYFHWGPAYVNLVESVKDGTWEQSWDWLGPDWDDINNQETTTVGFLPGPGLSAEAQESLDAFIAEVTAFATDPANEGTFFLWQGPLAYQDGTVIAAEGESLPAVAPLGEAPSVWYLSQLLDGMVGASN
jgi:simple sugar transport system substrate-binding protein